MRNRFDSVISTLMAIAALGVAAAFVHREFFPSRTNRSDVNTLTFVRDWENILDAGIRSGPSTGRVTLIEFTDLECPYCRNFHQNLRSLQQRYPNDVSHLFVHYPLSIHRFAEQAARAAECAERAGRFGAFIDVVFQKQDSIGLKTWTDFAHEAGIRDTSAIDRCVEGGEAAQRVQSDRTVGDRFGVSGTPTVIINGWRFAGTPSDVDLFTTVEALLAGKRPPAAIGDTSAR